MLSLAAERKGGKAGAAKCCRKFLDIWKDADPGLPEVEDDRFPPWREKDLKKRAIGADTTASP